MASYQETPLETTPKRSLEVSIFGFFLDKSFWQILETLLTFFLFLIFLSTFRWRLHWNFWGCCHQVKLCWNFAPDSFDDDHFWSQRTRGCWKSLSSLIEGQKVNQRSQAVIFRVPIVIPNFFCKKSLIFPWKKTFRVEENLLKNLRSNKNKLASSKKRYKRKWFEGQSLSLFENNDVSSNSTSTYIILHNNTHYVHTNLSLETDVFFQKLNFNSMYYLLEPLSIKK